jgi:indole-3-glycerol phosphate synthase
LPRRRLHALERDTQPAAARLRRDFAGALCAKIAAGPAVIAEIKKASPSKCKAISIQS